MKIVLGLRPEPNTHQNATIEICKDYDSEVSSAKEFAEFLYFNASSNFFEALSEHMENLNRGDASSEFVKYL